MQFHLHLYLKCHSSTSVLHTFCQKNHPPGFSISGALARNRLSLVEIVAGRKSGKVPNFISLKIETEIYVRITYRKLLNFEISRDLNVVNNNIFESRRNYLPGIKEKSKSCASWFWREDGIKHLASFFDNFLTLTADSNQRNVQPSMGYLKLEYFNYQLPR